MKPKSITFGAMGDTHLGSVYEDLTSLNAFYNELLFREIHTVFHTGNIIEGEAPFNKTELNVSLGFEAQAKYFSTNYPQRAGIDTYYISAQDHEGWLAKREGVEVGKRLEQTARDAGRTDLHYLGSVEADVVLELEDGPVRIRVAHPGGGSAAAVSHAAQRIVDSYSEGDKPDIMLVGHYHKAHHLPNYKGVHVIQTGTFQQQSVFMRLKNLRADVGGWILTISHSSQGLLRLTAEYLHYSPYTWQPRATHSLDLVI